MKTDEQAIREVVATWIAATKAGDVETVLGLMTEDVVFLVPGQPPMIGKSAYAAAARPKPGQPVATEAEADRAFAALSVGGRMGMPLAKTFWSPRFGMLTDRFGIGWMM